MVTVLHLRNPVSGETYRKTAEYGFNLQEAVDAIHGRRLQYGKIVAKPQWLVDIEYADMQKDMYACGFLPPHYPVPMTMLDAVLACANNPQALRRWSVPWFKEQLLKRR